MDKKTNKNSSKRYRDAIYGPIKNLLNQFGTPNEPPMPKEQSDQVENLGRLPVSAIDGAITEHTKESETSDDENANGPQE